MSTKACRGVVCLAAMVVASASAALSSSVGAAQATTSDTGPLTVELLLDGAPVGATLAWSALAQGNLSLRLEGAGAEQLGQGGPADAPGASISCVERATGELGRMALPIVDSAEGELQVVLVPVMPGLPYPIDPLAIESKPAAIISQQARRSVLLLPAAELRDRFRDTVAYMLQTADHQYRVPFGDGAMDCLVEVGVIDPTDGSQVRAVTAPVAIMFGRGAPEGPFPRDGRPLATGDWPSWQVTTDAVPTDLADAFRAALGTPATLIGSPSADLLAARRLTDDGGAAGPWLSEALGLLATRGLNPPRAARLLAMVSVAMSDALRVRRELVDAAGAADGPQEAVSEHLVTAGAAATVLRAAFPDDTAVIDDLERVATEAWSSGIPEADVAYHALGAWVGDQIVARGASDGSSEKWQGTPPTDPGLWVSTVPGGAPPLEPLAGTWQPWNLAAGDSLRPAEPPRPGDPVFEEETREVWQTGLDLDLTGQQIASYWEDKYGSLTPPGHWASIALQLVRADGWSTDHAALLFALLTTAQADAFIAAWDAKYAYWSIRPVTAIRASLDRTWRPYIVTPNFPSYVSGHSSTSGAGAGVLASLSPLRAEEILACAQQAADSRLLGGIHFWSDNEVGLALGAAVAEEALARVDASAIAAEVPPASGALGCLWEAGRG